MGVVKYTKEVIKEAKRVRWPKKDVFLFALLTTLIICIFVALVLRLEDLIGMSLMESLRKVFEGVKK